MVDVDADRDGLQQQFGLGHSAARPATNTRTLFGCADVAFVGDQLVVKSEDVSEVRRAETSGAARSTSVRGKQGPSWPVPTTRRWSRPHPKRQDDEAAGAGRAQPSRSALVTSAKPDVVHLTSWGRLGELRLWDPSGVSRYPTGWEELRWSPVVGCQGCGPGLRPGLVSPA